MRQSVRAAALGLLACAGPFHTAALWVCGAVGRLGAQPLHRADVFKLRLKPPLMSNVRLLNVTLSVPELREMTLQDAALRIQLHRALRRESPAPSLEEVFPDCEEMKLHQARVKASMLFQCAYQIGDKLLGKEVAYDEVVAYLASSHPGFSEESYSELIHYGCFLAR